MSGAIVYPKLVRSFTLPSATLDDKVTAELKDGMLRIHLPKDGKTAAKAVEIKVA